MQRRMLITLFLLSIAIACRDWSVLIEGQPQPDASTSDAAACTSVSSIAEDCSNGVDDNDNCLVDCADQDCKWSPLCRPDAAAPVDMTTPPDMAIIDLAPMG